MPESKDPKEANCLFASPTAPEGRLRHG